MTLKRLLPIALLSLSLAACGKNDADVILEEMHDRYVTQAVDNAAILMRPDIGTMETNVRLNTEPIKDMFEGVAALSLDSTSKYDITKKGNPLAEMLTHLTVSVDAPAGTFGIPSDTKEPDHADAEVLFTARSVDHTLLLNIGTLSVNIPFLQAPFLLPPSIAQNWYGAPFSELDASIKQAMDEQEDGRVLPPVAEMITNAFSGTRATPEAVKRAAKDIHLWKGIEVLPEENGMLNVRVRTDKQKIRKSVKAALRYVQDVSGSQWNTQLKNPEFKEMVSTLTASDAQYLQDMGTVEGVLSIDKDTLELRGFDGDVLDESGAKSGHISFMFTKERDASLSMQDEESGSQMHFTKEGEQLTLALDDKTVMEGTLKEKSLSLTFMDPESGKTAGTLKVDVEAYDKEHVSVKEVSLNLVEEEVSVALKNLVIRTPENAGSVSVETAFEVSYQGKTVARGTFKSALAPTEAFSVEKPQYSPFEALQSDFYQAMLGDDSMMTDEGDAEDWE